jgi:ATP-dependent Clp endopeptidase proteolytic subunit ClpP
MTMLERSGFDQRASPFYARRMAEVQINLAGSVSSQTIQTLMELVSERVGKGARSILLAISSPGGNIFWGVTAYNFLRGIGVEIITHNVGQVDSIAGVIYCAGDRRLCVPDARFLIHGVAAQFANENISEKDLRSRLANLEQNRDTIASIIATRTGRPLGDVKGDILNERIMDAEQAREYGFVTEITSSVFDPAQEIVQIISMV